MSNITVHVEVTQEDIDRGVSISCFNCPVAIAMARAVGRSIEVRSTAFWIPKTDYADNLPPDAIKFIAAFDSPYRRQYAKPFSFDVDIPEEYLPKAA